MTRKGSQVQVLYRPQHLSRASALAETPGGDPVSHQIWWDWWEIRPSSAAEGTAVARVRVDFFRDFVDHRQVGRSDHRVVGDPGASTTGRRSRPGPDDRGG